ncbi:metallophosphoesterase [Halorussus salinus]|uniref:metallophosphoesterase n=1 Tax=Halorussus salinus TaxID=1364935 RepID=UPI0010931B3E|nr:metallophosphoesterase [Halorussus salinus]
MTDTYYFVSDLHIGGDEQLEHVDFLDELLAFLRDLETTDEEAELIINGDAFGLWEFTEVEGPAKFDALVDSYPELFEQLRATGEEVPITLIPGNHDYELAAYDEYVERLAAYNVTLEQEVSLTREVGDYEVYVEHGMQRDPNNRIPDFGNPYANPPGYFVNRQITSRAGRLSGRGKYNWLKDIQAVTPMTRIPDWMMSNYFYREMSAWLRYAAVPFLLLFNFGLLYVAVFVLAETGVWSLPMRTVEGALGLLGPVGRLVDLFLAANLVLVGLLVAVSIPLYVFARDVRKTLRRFGLVRSDDETDAAEEYGPAGKYVEGARAVFAESPETAVFVYGHTHRVSLTEVEDRVILNTGTWLKRLHRKNPVVGILPPVFYSSYRLNYFRLSPAEDGRVVVEYEVVDKENPSEETLLQRLVTRSPTRRESIPDRTVVGPDAGERGATSESTPGREGETVEERQSGRS